MRKRADPPDLREDEFLVRTSRCPYCKHKLDTATNTEDNQQPQPGDFSVCINCAEPLVFDEDMDLRPCTLAERSEAGWQLDRVIRAIKRVNKQRRRQS
jgi:hypothetical protein